MRKKLVAKGNVRRGDFIRVVLTETLPEEVPLIFSNDGFYKNQATITNMTSQALEFFEVLLSSERRYTKPYRFSVLRDNYTARRLSLVHPSAQLAVAKFYKDYDSLICHFSSKSPASLRAPVKVGASFFVRGTQSEANRFKAAGIDTVTLETTTSNPASYFAYNMINRAHEFFNSNDYIHLEKKFELFRTLDVSKCFNSIYTHSLFWAVADVETAKDNAQAVGFANDFDRLMQSMNYNETNGICIGPEVSRVFAEIIFSEIDKRIIDCLSNDGLMFRSDYEFRRYVDDFYIFAKNHVILDKVSSIVQTTLGDFNLHLNSGKVVTIARPFATPKSVIINEVNDALNVFLAKVLSYRVQGSERHAVPLRIWRSDALIRSFISQVKATCTMHNTGYETVSDYIVSALSKRVVELADGYSSEGAERTEAARECMIDVNLVLIELCYFFYTVNPTVRASLHVARSVITATRIFKNHFQDRLPHLSESVMRWTLDVAKSVARGGRHRELTAVPLEVLNILIPMSEVVANEPLVEDLIEESCCDVSNFEYFEIVTFLFLTGGRPRHRDLIGRLFTHARKIVDSGPGLFIDSQSIHLCFDLLTCPFLPLPKRASWFNRLRGRVGLQNLSVADSQAAVRSMESFPWFIKWDGVDLLKLLRKKELSAIY